MNLQRRVAKLERRTQGAGVRFVVITPRKMTRDEWAAHVRSRSSRGQFVIDLSAVDGAGA